MSRFRSASNNSVSHLDEARHHVHPCMQMQVFRQAFVFDDSGVIGATTLDADTAQTITLMTAFPACGFPVTNVIVGCPYVVVGTFSGADTADFIVGTTGDTTDTDGFLTTRDFIALADTLSTPAAALHTFRTWVSIGVTIGISTTNGNIADLRGSFDLCIPYMLLPYARPQTV